MKIAIVGVGHVGATLAYTLLGTEPIDHLLLIGRNQSRLEGEALDLRHASAFVATPPKISFGSVADCSNADIVVLTLAVPQDEPDRNAKVAANARLFAEVVPQIAAQNPNSILLVATNPVEAMTQLTIELSGFGSERVVGTGTIIDSCRLRVSLSEHLGVHPDDLRVRAGRAWRFAVRVAQWSGGWRCAATCRGNPALGDRIDSIDWDRCLSPQGAHLLRHWPGDEAYHP